MSGRCAKPGCGLADGLGCENGELSYRNCPNYSSETDAAAPADSAADTTDDSGFRLPWTGRALGFNDLILASARSSPELVALVGPYNAGKTALLTAMFVRLATTGRIGQDRFAGSFSLEGWGRLRDYTNWPNVHGHGFPPHTPDSTERVPSLLHLAFRRDGGKIRDYLFTDAPGEWFTRWLNHQHAEDAAGARWIAANATRFVYVVDREGLASAERGQVRLQTQALGRLLAEKRRERPVIAAWTKSDKAPNQQIEGPLRGSLREFFGDHASMNVSVHDESSVELLSRLLEPLPASQPLAPAMKSRSAFLAFAGGGS